MTTFKGDTNNALYKALLNSSKKYRHQLKGRRVWLACSGGRDSLSLALMCRQLFDQAQLSFLPQLLHVNHGMQEANTAWAQYVCDWSLAHDMPCQILTVSLSDKTEQAARHARYQAMMDVMNTGDVLMLGHHQDDQVETVLMRLFNGAGVHGLGGMREWSAKSIESSIDKQSTAKTVSLWRPWLHVSRAQITQYAQNAGLKYIDDPTNIMNKNYEGSEQAGNDRAWLRSAIIPLLLERYPQVNRSIFRSSLLMQDASQSIEQQVTADLDHVLIDQTKPLSACDKRNISTPTLGTSSIPQDVQSIIDIDHLQRLPQSRQSALIHHWLQPHSFDLPPSKQLVDNVLALSARLDSDHQTQLYWDSGGCQYEIRRYQNKLYRLQTRWVSWLQQSPSNSKINDSVALDDYIDLKPVDSDFKWYLKGLQSLSACLPSTPMEFEALPRDVKLTLAGRQGSKSGKKLLQAIGLPSFMRQSAVLCSLVHEYPKQASDTSANLNTPLFLITIDGLFVLQSPFSQDIITLINQNKLRVQVIEAEIKTSS